MPEKRFFFKLAGAALLGLAALIIAIILFILLLPLILSVWPALLLTFLGIAAAVVIFVVLWLAVYALLFIGTAIYYLFRPMEVSREKKGYTITKSREAGRREKGKTRKKGKRTK